MRRFSQVLILVNIAIVAVIVGVSVVHEAGKTGPQALPAAVLLDLAAPAVGYVAICLLALIFSGRQPAWLLAPATFLIPMSVDGIYQAVAGIGPFAPAVIRPLLVVGYVVCYLNLRQKQVQQTLGSRAITETA